MNTNAVALLLKLDHSGCWLEAHDDRLRVGPPERLDPPLVAEVRQLKPELLPLRQPATVANAKALPDRWLTNPNNVYIGRAVPRLGIPTSPYANRFKLGRDGNRAEVIRQYRRWLCGQSDLIRQAVAELPGKQLVCWCTPEPCHGGVLLELLSFFCAKESL